MLQLITFYRQCNCAKPLSLMQTNSSSVTTQMKATEQYFSALLLIFQFFVQGKLSQIKGEICSSTIQEGYGLKV